MENSKTLAILRKVSTLTELRAAIDSAILATEIETGHIVSEDDIYILTDNIFTSNEGTASVALVEQTLSDGSKVFNLHIR